MKANKQGRAISKIGRQSDYMMGGKKGSMQKPNAQGMGILKMGRRTDLMVGAYHKNRGKK